MWMLFCKCFIAGFGTMLGLEIALGLCIAFGGLGSTQKEEDRDERN